jgi:hypothetical protein
VKSKLFLGMALYSVSFSATPSGRTTRAKRGRSLILLLTSRSRGEVTENSAKIFMRPSDGRF